MCRKPVALLLTVALLLMVVAPVMARTPEEILAIRQYFQSQIDSLHTADKMSNDEVYGVYVDLNQVPQGTVSTTVYKTVYENMTTVNFNNITIQPIQGINGAHDKTTRFWAYLDNYDDENFLAQWGGAPANTVIGYVYGTTKNPTLDAFVAGIPECLLNIRLYDSGTGDLTSADAWAEKYRTANWVNRSSDSYDDYSFSSNTTTTNQTIQPQQSQQPATPQMIENQPARIIFTPDSQTYTVNGETRQMDVKPYFKNGLLYVPVRFLAYGLGFPDSGIQWDQNNRSVTITKDKVTIILIIGSPVMLVNGQPITMDIAPEIKNNRTMLPSEWITNVLEEPGS